MKKNKVRLMLDSGAFTAWTKGESIDLKEYITYIKKHRAEIDTYFNLDVIPGGRNRKPTEAEIDEAAKQSYKNLQTMKKAGLDPIPVFHFGEDFKWLEKLLADGHKYIGIGALVGKPELETKRFLDKVFTRLTTRDGKPIIKVHGLGVSSFELIRRYPFYSCDATSWALTAAYGSIYLPKYKNGKPDYTQDPIKLTISDAKREGGVPNDHFVRYGDLMTERVKDFLEKHVGVDAKAASEDYVERARAVVYFMIRFAEAIKDEKFRHRTSSMLS